MIAQLPWIWDDITSTTFGPQSNCRLHQPTSASRSKHYSWSPRNDVPIPAPACFNWPLTRYCHVVWESKGSHPFETDFEAAVWKKTDRIERGGSKQRVQRREYDDWSWESRCCLSKGFIALLEALTPVSRWEFQTFYILDCTSSNSHSRVTQDMVNEELERQAVISLYGYLLLYKPSMYHALVIYHPHL